MKLDLLKKLFTAIGNKSDREIISACNEIIRYYKQNDRTNAAKELANAIKAKKSAVRVQEATITSLPTLTSQSKMNVNSLFTITSPEILDHELILSSGTEKKFIRIESEFAARGRLLHHGLSPRKKILIYGPDGCGKTLGAKRLAWKTGLQLVTVKMSLLANLSMYEILNTLSVVFDYCSKNQSLLLLDECDFLGSGDYRNINISKENIFQLIEEYVATGLVVITVGTEDALDKKIINAFDDYIFLDRPNDLERKALFNYYLKYVAKDPYIDFDSLAISTKNFSYRELVKITENATKDAFLTGDGLLKEVHLQRAIVEHSRSGI